VQDYIAWIDGFAAGYRQTRRRSSSSSPTALGIIPWYNQFGNKDEGWGGVPSTRTTNGAKPAEADKATASGDRFAMINYAVDKLKANPGTHVYLDGTHSSWLGANDAADRLLQAGVTRAGWFLPEPLELPFGRVPRTLRPCGSRSCIWFGDTASGLVGRRSCRMVRQPSTTSIRLRRGEPERHHHLGRLGRLVRRQRREPDLVPYPGDAGLKRFVIDTSRNGLGRGRRRPPIPTRRTGATPPLRGVGARPTADTGNALLGRAPVGEDSGRIRRRVHARPGSGRHNRGSGMGHRRSHGPGYWFPEMALQLAQNAVPALSTSCH
jgi:endoglucanase